MAAWRWRGGGLVRISGFFSFSCTTGSGGKNSSRLDFAVAHARVRARGARAARNAVTRGMVMYMYWFYTFSSDDIYRYIYLLLLFIILPPPIPSPFYEIVPSPPGWVVIVFLIMCSFGLVVLWLWPLVLLPSCGPPLILCVCFLGVNGCRLFN